MKLILVAPDKNLFEGEVDSVILPGIDGELGILPRHADMVTALGAGPLRFREHSDGKWHADYLVEGGFARVDGEQVLVLSGNAWKASELDRKQEEEHLQQLLSQVYKDETEFEEKEAKLAAARAKIKFAGSGD